MGPALRGAIAFAAMAAVGWIAVAVMLASVVGRVFLQRATLAGVAGVLTVMIVVLFLRAGLLWASEATAQLSADRAKRRLRRAIGAKLAALGPMYVGLQRNGELVYAASEGTESVDPYLIRFYHAKRLAIIVPPLVAIVVFMLDPVAVVVLLATWPVLVLLQALIGQNTRSLAERRERELAWLSAHFLDVLRGLPTLKMFNRSAEQAETIATLSRHYSAATMDVLKTAFQTTLVMEWGAIGATALIAVEASVRLMGGALPFDHALAALLLAPEFFLPLRRFSAEYHAGTTGRAALARIYRLLDEPIPQRSGAVPKARARLRVGRLGLDFTDVHVRYPGATSAALRGFSLEVPQGQTVALIGPSGAGKSTVANLLLRFVEPEGGTISVGGTPLSAIDPAEWRQQVALVPQHPSLFHRSVGENIRLARPDATDDEVVAAARLAQAFGFISELPQGVETMVGENGVRLSGGERQRIAIARAVLKDAPILILDEPTAHLDAATATLLWQALERLRQGRTVILITHNAQALRSVDRVAPMEAGRVFG